MKRSPFYDPWACLLWSCSVYLLIQQSHTADGRITYLNACTYSRIGYCIVDHGKASCTTPDIAATVAQVPSCVTDLQLVLSAYNNSMQIGDANFTHLDQLQRLSIKAETSDIHYKTNMVFHGASPTLFKNQRDLKTLHINLLLIFKDVMFDFLKPLTSLEHLDLNGATNAPLIEATFPATCPIKELHLRRTQAIQYMEPGRQYAPNLDISRLLCPLGKTLQLVDLSYNSIVMVILDKDKLECMEKLQVLDLRYNFLDSIRLFDPKYHTLPSEAIGKLPNPTVIDMLTFQTPHFLLGTVNRVNFKGIFNLLDTSQPSYQDLMRVNVPKTDLFLYIIDYLKYISNMCKVHTDTFINCAISAFNTKLHTEEIACRIKLCVLSNRTRTDYNECACDGCIGTQYNIIQNQLTAICNTECMFGVAIPFFPWMKTFILNNYEFERALPDASYVTPRSHGGTVHKLCIDPNNKLNHLDISNFKMIKLRYNFTTVITTGLHHLESLNMSGIDTSYFVEESLADMPSLKYLNLSYNRMDKNGILKDSFFKSNGQLSSIDISSMAIRFIEYTTFNNLTYLADLDMRNNYLNGSLNLKLSNISHLKVANNHIETISPEMLHDLERISLVQDVHVDASGNPWSCGCGNLDFLTWIQNNETRSNLYLDSIDAYHCENNPGKPLLIDLDLAALKASCQEDITKYLISIFGTLAAVILVTVPFIVYRKRWILRHFFFVTKEKLTWRQNVDGIDDNYEYDVFISYSNEDIDRTWVHFTLLPELENTYGFRGYIHHRNFIGGIDIAENIQMAIEKSRKVVAVLSPDFLRSNWCCEEIKMTDNWDKEHGTNKIIFVMYRNLGNCEVPSHIAYLLSTKTFIDVSNPMSLKVFWPRLAKAIYAKTRRRRPRNRDLVV